MFLLKGKTLVWYLGMFSLTADRSMRVLLEELHMVGIFAFHHGIGIDIVHSRANGCP
jgi:hypothetical protein